MGFIKGLAAINDLMDEQKKRSEAAASYQKVNWLKLSDGESVKIRFAQELDEDSPGYDESRGLAVVVAEHSAPDNFRLKASCTTDTEGRCWACQQNDKNPREGWKRKLRYYTNVVVDNGKDRPYVAVWSQGVSNRSAFNVVREYAIDMGSVSNLTWKLRRNGTGTETSYVLVPMAPDSEPYDWSGFEFFNLEKIVREVPYAEQEDFYTGQQFAEAKNVATSASIDW